MINKDFQTQIQELLGSKIKYSESTWMLSVWGNIVKYIEMVYNRIIQRFYKRPMTLYAFYHVYGVASCWTR
jgi:hypothetical protein